MRQYLELLKQTFSEWSQDKAPVHAAALAFYTLFSLAPLLLILISILAIFFGEGAAQERLLAQVRELVGPAAAEVVETTLENAAQGGAGVIGTIIGLVTLLLGATGILVQLQSTLNSIWKVKPDPAKTGIMHLIKVRLLSFAMLLVIGFLLLVSLVVSAALAASEGYLVGLLPGAAFLWQLLNFLVSFAVITVLFALMFKYLPEANIAWGDVWIGAAVTALLFEIGKVLLGLYLGNAAVASSFGAAGSLVALLLWVYYSAQILLFGAEFTQVYARRFGSRFEPAKHAVKS